MGEGDALPQGTRYLRRAIAAEEGLESSRERVAELERQVAAMIRATGDPLLFNVIHQCEALLNEALSSGTGGTWRVRATAQLRAVRILQRDDV